MCDVNNGAWSNITSQLFVQFFISLVTSTQTIRVSGIVSNTAGEPLAGVTVEVKGVQNGTMTNANGQYEITNVPATGTLVFSFVGFESLELEVCNQDRLNVTLQLRVESLDQIVVVGYGKMAKNLADFISSTLKYPDGSVVQCEPAETTIDCAKAALCATKFGSTCD